MLGFAALMVVAGARMLTGDVPSGGACALPGGGVDWRSCLPKSLAAGTAVGLLTGLFGVGGGFLVIPALVLGLGLPMAAAVGTSLVIVTANAAAGFAVHAGDAALDPMILGGFTAAAVAGSLAAARAAHRVNADRLRRWFALFVFAVAAFTTAQTLLNPPYPWPAVAAPRGHRRGGVRCGWGGGGTCGRRRFPGPWGAGLGGGRGVRRSGRTRGAT
ncbi:sulfite exporter TauE/SafE family protein [Actinomadura sp. CNU-125]|uniref:sulfite exporter TauE/SafE family protein n=1 Tax=Actinomadura sp. CNU-125 TaxID=1904961 RepID=UPI00096A6607|nr:sulfite exporter TauE/SafE family protein [Actinomadura sp. CNU-125]